MTKKKFVPNKLYVLNVNKYVIILKVQEKLYLHCDLYLVLVN